jgi:O-antigen/teichoic acid export membrane protein
LSSPQHTSLASRLPTPKGHPDLDTENLKRKTIRGIGISTTAQAISFVLRTGSMMVLARLLFPKDFGLVGMVAALTGFLSLFRDFGLSLATVQRSSLSDDQVSAAFWVNCVVGLLLAALCAAVAPLLVVFYREPRLLWVTVALGTGFIFTGAASQHRAMLQRKMRFGALAVVDIVALVSGIAVGIGMAATGVGYWSLVWMSVISPVVAVAAVWVATPWLPGRPRWPSGIRSLLMYGGTVTLNNIVIYFAYNVDKVLLGRFCGAELLGIYGRAYQLINLPTDNLNSTAFLVAFPSLSRIQNDPARVRSFFLKGYSLFLAVAIPISVSCALFAEDIILVFLGPKWHEAASLFRLLVPTIIVFALINPLGWLMLATGYAARSLRISFLLAPVVIVGYVLGLPYGPQGVAVGFSVAMVLLAAPVIIWSKHGTLITWGDIMRAIAPSFLSSAVAAAVALGIGGFTNRFEPSFLRLVVESGVELAIYLVMLLFVMNQKPIYLELLREIKIWPFGGRQRTEAAS